MSNISALVAPNGLAVSPDDTRLYVGEQNGNVAVVNTATNTVIGSVTVGALVDIQGIAINQAGTRLYTANGTNSVFVIDTSTNTVLTTIAISDVAFRLTVSPNGSRVYVDGGSSVVVINATNNTVQTTIALGAVADGIAVSPDGSRLYVPLLNHGVDVIDTTTDAVVATIATPGVSPEGISISPDGTQVYVSGGMTGTSVLVIDTATNTVVDTVPVGSGPLHSGACDNGNALLATGLTFKANTSGALACTLTSGATGPVFTGGTLQFAGANISSSLPITLMAAGGIFDTDGNNATLSGAISGPGGLTKIGLGTLTLSGAGTYSGPTAVNVGTLQAGAASAFSLNSAYTIATGATLDLNNFNQTIGSLAGAGAVTLGSATLTTGNDGTSTMFSGLVSGTGGLNKIGGGTFILTGANSYIGGTAINAGTLQIGNGGTSGAIIGNVIDNATFAIDRPDTYKFAGAISGGGAFVQMGSGKTVLTGTSSYAGTTTISGGTLEVDGALTGTSGVTVSAGSTLTGTGTVDPLTVSFASGATFIPGTAGVAGTSMNIVGNLMLNPGASYQIYLNPTTSSFANVTGTAALGGTVKASFASGSYISKQYTILSAGAVGGTFASLTNTNLPNNFSDSLAYDGAHAYLDLTLNYTPPSAPSAPSYTPLNTNQANVAAALVNDFNTTGGIPTAFGTLTPAGLTAIDGEAATGAADGAFKMMDQFLNLMLDPFVDGRSGTGWPGGGNGGAAMGFAPGQQASFPPDVALGYAGVLKAPPKPQSFEQRWSAWGGAFGGSNTTNGNAAVGSNTVTAQDYGYAAGMDYHFSPDTVAGFALAGGGTNWGLAQGLGGGRSDAFQAGVYGATRSGPAYVATALAFANHWMSTNRIALGDQLDARFSAQSYAGRIEAGYRYAALPTIGVTPYAALQAQSFHTPNYSETDLTGGGFALGYNAMTATDTRSELGARFDDITVVNGMPLSLRGRLAWAHDWITNPALDAVFQSLPGASFIVNGATPPKSSALASAGAELHLTANWSATAKFDGEFASGSQTYAGTGTLRYTW